MGGCAVKSVCRSILFGKLVRIACKTFSAALANLHDDWVTFMMRCSKEWSKTKQKRVNMSGREKGVCEMTAREFGGFTDFLMKMLWFEASRFWVFFTT